MSLTKRLRMLASLTVLTLGLLTPQVKAADNTFITLASTTSTRDSGLFDSILPIFQKKTGIEVRVVAVGTGKAIKLARNGDADVLFVHHRKSEDAFVAEGYGVKRYDVMYNDFVVVGPKSDPAGIRGEQDVARAFGKIASASLPFLSRGDDSGTNKKERGLWKTAGIDTAKVSGTWYRETGSGMGATLNTASAMNGYSMSDRGTWLAFQNRGDLAVLVEGDKRLLNPYGVILVDEKRHAHVKSKPGQQLIDWLVSKEGQTAIAAFKINGEQLFRPNAK